MNIRRIVTVALVPLLATTATAQSTAVSAGSNAPVEGDGPIVVGSADFPESELMAQIYGQALAEAGFDVSYQLGIGSREIYFDAIESGEVDLVPEYTNSLLSFVLRRDDPEATPEATRVEEQVVALDEALPEGLEVLTPSAAQDKDVIVCTAEAAEEYDLTTLSDLASVMEEITLAAPPEFEGRSPFGLVGFTEILGASAPAEFVPLDVSGVADALTAGAVDCGNLFSTMSVITTEGLVALQDDGPLVPDEAVLPLVRSDIVDDDALTATLDAVSAVLDTEALKALMVQVEVEALAPEVVAGEWLARQDDDPPPSVTTVGRPTTGRVEPSPTSPEYTYSYDDIWIHMSQMWNQMTPLGRDSLCQRFSTLPFSVVLAEDLGQAPGGAVTYDTTASFDFLVANCPTPTTTATTAVTESPAVPPTTVQLSAASIDELPAIPTQVEGYTPYESIRTDQFLIIEGGGAVTPPTFRGQMNNCGAAFWVARWRTLNPNTLVQGGRGPYDADTVDYDYEPWLMPPAQSAGYLSGFICERPIFLWGGTRSRAGGNLDDILIEWQYYDASVRTGPSPEPTDAAATCARYTYSETLPLQLCDEGPGIAWLQRSLSNWGYSVSDDGHFGPGTLEAVKQFQSANGLVPNGLVGPETWSALGAGWGLPGWDLNQDGMITPDEISGS